ncbi:MAG: methylisocitrate lyase [Thermoprotei archaeon]
MSQSESKPAELARLLATEDIVVAPGVFNPISAMVAARVGFKALYFSGGGFANSLGLPDLGLTTLTEVAGAVGGITRVVGAPLIVDIDTGFGEALNVGRTVRELELAGAAGVHIEDQVMPKKCGHLPNKEVVGVEDMVKKILAAVESRRNGLLVVARTDARAVEGFDEAVERARVYVRAGADMIFPEALESEEEFKEFARKVEAPLLANMTEFGKTPYIPVSKFREMGYKVVIFPMTAFRVMLRAIERAYTELFASGTQVNLLDSMMSRAEIYKLIDYYSFEKNDAKLAARAKELINTSSKL